MVSQEVHELLAKHGLWVEELPAEDPSLEAKPDVDDDCKRLLLAYEKALAFDDSNKLLIAKICAYLRRSSGLKVQEIAEWLMAACPRWEKTFSTVCRYVRAGDLLLEWPQLEGVGNIDKLSILRRVPKELQAEVFSTGLLPSGQPIRELDREALTAAVNALRSPKPVPRVIPAAKARREIEGCVNAIQAVAQELAQLERFPKIQAQLQQWAKELEKMLQEALVVPKPAAPGPVQHLGRTQVFIR